MDKSKTIIGKAKRRLNELKEIKVQKDLGKIFCIPFESYPKLAESVPGIVPGMITMITAGSGVGKTQVAKALAVRQPLEYALKNNIKLKIFYFALEESEQEFIDTMICNFISSKCNIRMDLLTLQGYKDKSLDQSLMTVISDNIDSVERLLDNVEIIDSVYHPTGIYKYCRDYADKNGTHHYEDRQFIKKKVREDGTEYTKKEVTKVYSHYEPDDSNAIVIVVVDHIGLLAREKDKDTGKMKSLHETIAQWSTTYSLKQITKHWKWAVVNIIQQEQSGEKEQFTNKGESIQKKTEPSLAGFANNKEIQRDAKVIIGVYSPDRYGFEEYHGYDVRRFRDTIRAFKILKNRFGAPNKYFHYLFDGATNRFKELPKSSEKRELLNYEQSADKLLGRVGTPRTTKNFGQS
ncbi:DnaB-like helicase C-terminal domain-containing protein [Clostridium sp.]|jgi:replicative DNA helicase|uniref:DnaB-like helicase C-terminal domain-containing protein n=1 Tax=Clostridium sp. TaxID=1506 RepID=UPI003EF00668